MVLVKPNFFQSVIYTILLYCMLFTAPFKIGGFPFNGFLALRLVAFAYILFNWKTFLCFYRMFHKEISIIAIVVVYSLFIGFLRDETSIILSDLSSLFTIIIVPFFLIDYGRKIGVDSTDGIVKYMLIATLVASSTSIAALIFPGVDNFIRNVVIQMDRDNFLLGNESRGFGWGGALTSEYAYVLAIMCGVGLFYNKRGSWFKFVLPFVLIASIINARTGFIIAVLGLAVYFINVRKLWISVLILFISVLFYTYMYDVLAFVLKGRAEAYRWVTEFFENAEDFANGEIAAGNMEILLKSHIWFPQTVSGWIFGEGVDLFGSVNIYGRTIHSDIGFIRQLFYGGLIYCSLLYYLLIHVVRRLRKRNQKSLSLFVLLSFFIINFKNVFLLNTFSFGAFMLLYYAIYILGCEQYPYPKHPLPSYRKGKLYKIQN